MDLADRIVAAGLEGERVRAEVVEGGDCLLYTISEPTRRS
jgi:hypothetical protein